MGAQSHGFIVKLTGKDNLPFIAFLVIAIGAGLRTPGPNPKMKQAHLLRFWSPVPRGGISLPVFTK